MHQIEIVNIDRNQNQILSEPLAPPPCNDPVSNSIQITFYCGSTRRIPLTIYNQIKLLQQPVIYRSVKLFDEYVITTLMTDKLTGNIDLASYISEIKAYGILPNQNQMIDISISSGLHAIISKTINFVLRLNSGCCMKNNKVQKIKNFSTIWDEYVKLLSIQYENNELELIRHTIIYDLIEERSISDLIKMNFQFDNIIFEYCKHFEEAVITDSIYDFELCVIQSTNDIIEKINNGGLNFTLDTIPTLINSLLKSNKLKLNQKQQDAVNQKILQIQHLKCILDGVKQKN